MARIFWILFLFIPLHAAAGPHYTWSDKARQAYEKTLQLRFTEARSLLNSLKNEDPSNLVRLHIENYIDFFTVFINEDLAEFQRLERNKDLRLQEIKKGPDSSPWHLYLQADIRLQWALARLKFEEYATAFMEVNKAFKLLEENARIYPAFMPNKKDLGILHAMVGTIPDNYKWAVDWLSSMKGSLDQGRSEMEEVIEYARTNDFIFEEETYVLYAYLLLHLDNKDGEAWRILQNSKLNPETNPMACFVMANVAMRTGRNDQAIELLEQRPGGRTFHPFPYLDFMLGIAKLQRLDSDASVYLQKFLDNYGGRNFIKEAWQKMAWQALIRGDQAGYRKYMELVKTRGFTVVEGDQNALREAKNGEMPHSTLLQARLLFDGGYYEQARKKLHALPTATLTRKRDQLEYQYRSGRICQALGLNDKALAYYATTIEQGAAEPWYFACRAALETGRIYEALGDKAKARSFYEKCLSIKPEESRVGIHQAAKAGLGRVKE